MELSYCQKHAYEVEFIRPLCEPCSICVRNRFWKRKILFTWPFPLALFLGSDEVVSRHSGVFLLTLTSVVLAPIPFIYIWRREVVYQRPNLEEVRPNCQTDKTNGQILKLLVAQPLQYSIYPPPPPYQPFDQSTVMALVSFSPPLSQGSFKHTFTSHSGISCQFSVFLIFWERIPTTNSRHNDRPNTSDVRDETHFYDRFALLHHFALLLGWCCLFCTGLSDSKFKHQQPNQFFFLFFLGSFTKEWKVRGNGNGTSPTVACLLACLPLLLNIKNCVIFLDLFLSSNIFQNAMELTNFDK